VDLEEPDLSLVETVERTGRGPGMRHDPRLETGRRDPTYRPSTSVPAGRCPVATVLSRGTVEEITTCEG
jgi:hypothetical protein